MRPELPSGTVTDCQELAWSLIARGGIYADIGSFEDSATSLREGCAMAAHLRNSELIHMALVTVASLTMRHGEPRTSAVLAGDVVTLSDELDVRPLGLHRMSATLQRIPDELTAEAFNDLFSEGRRMDSGEALSYPAGCLD